MRASEYVCHLDLRERSHAKMYEIVYIQQISRCHKKHGSVEMTIFLVLDVSGTGNEPE
jgi:hypothetical protein